MRNKVNFKRLCNLKVNIFSKSEAWQCTTVAWDNLVFYPLPWSTHEKYEGE